MTTSTFRSAAIAQLKSLRAEGYKLTIKLTASNIDLYNELQRFEAMFAAAEADLAAELLSETTEPIPETAPAKAIEAEPIPETVQCEPDSKADCEPKAEGFDIDEVNAWFDVQFEALAEQAKELEAVQTEIETITVEAEAVEAEVLEVIAELLVLVAFTRPALKLKHWAQVNVLPTVMVAIAPALLLLWDTKYVLKVVKPQQGLIDCLTLVMLGAHWVWVHQLEIKTAVTHGVEQAAKDYKEFIARLLDTTDRGLEMAYALS